MTYPMTLAQAQTAKLISLTTLHPELEKGIPAVEGVPVELHALAVACALFAPEVLVARPLWLAHYPHIIELTKTPSGKTWGRLFNGLQIVGRYCLDDKYWSLTKITTTGINSQTITFTSSSGVSRVSKYQPLDKLVSVTNEAIPYSIIHSWNVPGIHGTSRWVGYTPHSSFSHEPYKLCGLNVNADGVDRELRWLESCAVVSSELAATIWAKFQEHQASLGKPTWNREE